MPLFDFKCVVCGEVGEYVFPSTEKASNQPPKHCGKLMERQASAPNFAIHGFNAKNGYASQS